MDSFRLIEYAATATVVGIQFIFFGRTSYRCRKLSGFFPEIVNLSTVVDGVDGANTANIGRGSVAIVAKGEVSPEFTRVLYATNQYMGKNRGLPIDFGIVQGIAERSSSAAEHDAAAYVSLPLYLGLMGTFAGVIVGLVSIANESTSSLSDLDLRRFLGGVLVAMFGSLCGLMLSVTGKGVHLQSALTENERRKQDYLTFLQTELLPVVGHDISTALFSLQRNLHQFNDDFSINLSKFANTLEVTSESLSNQGDLLEAIRNLNVNDMMGANAKLLTQIKSSSSMLIGFTQATETLKSGLSDSVRVVTTFAALLDRVTTFEKSVNQLGEKLAIDQSAALTTVELIKAQLDTLTNRTSLVEQFVDVEDKEIHDFLSTQREQLKDLTTSANQQLAEVITELQRSLREDFLREEAVRFRELGDRLSAVDEKVVAISAELKSMETSEYHKESLRLLADISANLHKPGFARAFLLKARMKFKRQKVSS